MKKKEYILEYNMVFMTILSLIILLLTFGICYLFSSDFFPEIEDILKDESSIWMIVVFYIIFIFWMVLHEIIHGLAYEIMGAKRENIVYGASLENGVFYCKCKEYINKKCIMISLLSPFILIGIVTLIIGYLINSHILVLLSIFNISGASGDLTMFAFFLHQDKDIEFKELGFSSPFCIKTTKDLTNKKYIGIKSIREVKDEKETEEGPEKKITISKITWIFLIIIFIMLISSLILYYLL